MSLHLLNHRSGVTISLTLDEANGDFACAYSPQPMKAQLRLIAGDDHYSRWLWSVGNGWARRHNGNGKAARITFSNAKLKGKIWTTTN
jgi:hypothetical protein